MYAKKNGRMTYKSNRRPNFKRNNNFGSKGRNKGNVTQQYNKYLKLAKDSFSSGDRIQSEYYYQFTDHYYRLMVELGINLEDQESSLDTKENIADISSTEKIEETSDVDTKLDETNLNEEIDQSIESIPFISEPVKKRRSKTSR